MDSNLSFPMQQIFLTSHFPSQFVPMSGLCRGLSCEVCEGLLKATNDKGHLLSTLNHCLAEIREQGLEHVSFLLCMHVFHRAAALGYSTQLRAVLLHFPNTKCICLHRSHPPTSTERVQCVSDILSPQENVLICSYKGQRPICFYT